MADLECMAIQAQDLLACFSAVFETSIERFPGNLPVSLDRDKLIQLLFGYLVTWKADGERVFVIFLDNSEVLRVHRDMRIYNLGCVPMKTDWKEKWFCFDAEYLASQNRLLIFDTIVFANQPCWRAEIGQRYEMAKLFVQHWLLSDRLKRTEFQLWCDKCSLPSNYHFTESFIPRLQPDDMDCTITVKPLFSFHFLDDMWKHRVFLDYPVDGLIFPRRVCSYRPFCQDPNSVIKWKPNNTLDFRVALRSEDMVLDDRFQEEWTSFISNTGFFALLCLNSTKQEIVFTFLDVEIRWCDKIVEFEWKSGTWKPLLVREDKDMPNFVDTVCNTLESINDNIQISDITGKKDGS